jgi:hypothetical protein
MIDAPVAAGVVVVVVSGPPIVEGPFRVDLIRGPRGGAGGNEAGAGPWGDVLSDV